MGRHAEAGGGKVGVAGGAGVVDEATGSAGVWVVLLNKKKTLHKRWQMNFIDMTSQFDI